MKKSKHVGKLGQYEISERASYGNDYSEMFEPKHDNGFDEREYDRNTKWLGVALLALFILGVIWANYQGLTVAL